MGFFTVLKKIISTTSHDNHIRKVSQKALARYKNKAFGEINSDGLFSFAKKHPLKNKNNEILEDGLALCRMDNNIPQKDMLRTTRDLITGEFNSKGVRNSLHFSLNHPVIGHESADWSKHKYFYIMPFNKVPNIVGGSPVDIFTKGSVRIPKGTVIVRQNMNIPEGKYKITRAQAIEEFKDLKGVKVIETNKPAHNVGEQILKKLGYEPQIGGLSYGWNDIVEPEFLNFLKQKGLFSAVHAFTPNARIEQLLELIFNRGHFNREWTVTNNGQKIFDFKDEYIKVLKYLEEFSQKNNYPIDFNTKKIMAIIQEAKTPKEAAKRINQELKLCTQVPQFIDVDDMSFIGQSKLLIGSANPISKKYNQQMADAINGKCEKMSLADFIIKNNYYNTPLTEF